MKLELYGGPDDGRQVDYRGGDHYEPGPSQRGENNRHGFPTVLRRSALYTPALHPYATYEHGARKIVLFFRGYRAR